CARREGTGYYFDYW
nr:immunoglobulin heavy chain junction region [Mus musculus]MBK4195209.1 immunoglobulin heavy chain junction region [Mus musculus]